MRSLFELSRFELRLQGRSALFLALLVVISAAHFFTARKLGINISLGAEADAQTLPLNSTLAIIQNELVLSLLAVFPAIAIVATAITRDRERRTDELFFTKPIRPAAYIGGRFVGALLLATAIALVGLASNWISLVAPGIDPQRLGPQTGLVWAYVLAGIVLPNTFIASSLVYCAAVLTRSLSGAFCAALLLALVPMLASANYQEGGSHLLVMADPFGVLAILDVTRFWSREDLLTRLPGGLFFVNRLLWIGLASALLAASLLRFRFVIAGGGRKRASQKQTEIAATKSHRAPVGVRPQFGDRRAFWSFAARTRMDVRALFGSPAFWFVSGLVAFSCLERFTAPASDMFNAEQWPTTGRLVHNLDVAIAGPIILAVAYFAGFLVHRERQARLADIIDALPVTTVTMVLAKITALAVLVSALLATGVGTFVVLQLVSGYYAIEFGLYLKGALVYGFNHYLLIVPAVLIHLMFANRWLGSLLFLATIVAALALAPLGFENLLYNFRVPPMPYSDMNGFGHHIGRTASLMAYLTGLCGLLAIGAVLIAPRGLRETIPERIAEARRRLGKPIVAAAYAFLVLFISAGSWIYFNTHILNPYVDSTLLEARAADYEKRYRHFEDLWAPRPTRLDLSLDFHPSERGLTSRGSMQVMNDSNAPVGQLLVTLNPALQVNALELEGAQSAENDDELGARIFRFDTPLQPGETAHLRFDFEWDNAGFPNGAFNNSLAANGSYVESADILPYVGYNQNRELEDETARSRQALPPARRLASLDDAQANADLSSRFLLPVRTRAIVSTEAGQTAVATGALQRRWRNGGREYAEYGGNMPLGLGFASARYEVLRDSSAGTGIEIFYHSGHASSVPAMLETAKRGIAYYNEQYGPYPAFAETFRIFEYPGYSTLVRALAGAVAYNERAGFTYRFAPGEIDFATAHELAHMWWGAQVQSSAVQGREVLNEALASYSAYMLVQRHQGREAVRRYLDFTRGLYLDGYSRLGTDRVLPVIRAETDLDTYGKGSLVLFTLQDAIGEEAVNGALRRFMAKYGSRPPPLPTTRELVAELRAGAGPEYQELITDLFERVTFYDVAVTDVESRRVASGYELTLTIEARKLYADLNGNEREAPLRAPFDIALYDERGGEPSRIAKYWLSSGSQRIVVRTRTLPDRVVVDPYGLMLDRRSDDNERGI